MRNLDLLKEEIIKCYHCGNETPMRQVGKYEWGSKYIEFTDFDFYYLYEMFACPVCHKVTLRETYSDETMAVPSGYGEMSWHNNKDILYPITSIDNGPIPQIIKDAYEAALKVKSIDKSLCLIALRRTLELILKDKGATKWGLAGKIEEIAKKGLLPDTLKEASSLTKILGDSAAHDNAIDIDIDQHDVERMGEFVEYIIEYLYVIPEKISGYKKLLSPQTDE